MAVFRNTTDGQYALVSYKALYSRFNGSDAWQQVGLTPTPRMFLSSKLKSDNSNACQIVRSPYSRVVSAFMDKFRKQPNRLHEPGFQWQGCHYHVLSMMGVKKNISDTEIQDLFLNWSFDEFIELLPAGYKKDVHFQPQYWTARINVLKNRWVTWPGRRIIRIEDTDELNAVPGIDFSVRSNTTFNIKRDFELEDKHKRIICSLYKKDFQLGGYDA